MNSNLREQAIMPHTYSRGADLLCNVARGFGVNITDQQSERWHSTFLAAHELDGILDTKEPYGTRSSQYDLMVDVIVGKIDHECSGCNACSLKCHIEQLPVDARELFEKNAEQIKQIGEVRRTSSRVRKLGQLTVREGIITAQLFEINERNLQHQAFNKWIADAGVFSNLIDTAVDLSSDYETGLTKVKPLLRNRMALIAMSLPFSTCLVRGVRPNLVRSYVDVLSTLWSDKNKDSVNSSTTGNAITHCTKLDIFD